MDHPILKVLSDQGCQCYLVGCPESGRALLVDPKAGRSESVQAMLRHYGLQIDAVVDTHSHADHLSDSAAWIEAGATLSMSHRTACRRKKRTLRDGDVLEVGQLRFRVIEVPGHTPDSIALYGHGLVLTGDSLLVGGLARADFRGSDPAELFDSVRERLLPLPGETLVFPGHSYNDLLFSMIAKERSSNPALQFESGKDYADALQAVEGRGNTPDVDAMLALNLEERPDLLETSRAVVACCSAGAAGPTVIGVEEQTAEALEARRDELSAQRRWIDVRDPYEFAAGRIPGARNIPLSELGFHLGELSGRSPLVLHCKAGVRSRTAVRTLRYLDVVDHPISLAGGFERWQESGHAVDTAPLGRS